MEDVTDRLWELAATGRLGRVRPGMPLAEAEDALGPGVPHPAIKMLGPSASGYPYRWGHLALFVADGRVDEVALEPTAPVGMETFLEGLRQANVPFEPYPELSSGQQIAMRTKVGAVAFFTHFDVSEDIERAGYYLVYVRNRVA
ncbi:hypothetical protein [Streptoalloteichus hindustanus]|uniref:Uncharacterized protein n=1 Tax=Streptoalloteichus hindustanus TaxID=2017 RepID=A0A1M5I4H2_STRHI|nr:hypothetical protein [Streptoalloteichus hindustanus]SHG23175.1 hypothetical protein SAMN05444320_107100 [Streptoalloteichus hindustanus]